MIVLQFGFCVSDDSIYCKKTTCNPYYSPWSTCCLVKIQKAPVKRFNWVVSSKIMAPEGFARQVSYMHAAYATALNMLYVHLLYMHVQ